MRIRSEQCVRVPWVLPGHGKIPIQQLFSHLQDSNQSPQGIVLKALSNLGVRNIYKKYDYLIFMQCYHCWIPKQCLVIPTSHSKLQEWDQPNPSTSLSNPSQLLTQPTGPWEQRAKLANLVFASRQRRFPLIEPSSTIISAEQRKDSPPSCLSAVFQA